MRLIALLACIVPVSLSGLAQDRVTVDQLEQRLAADHNRSDRDLAQRLANMQLTQRISIIRLEKLEGALPGPESRGQLLGVADLSEMLDLPPGEIPADQPPPAAEQQGMLARAVEAEYVPGSLPDFDATVDITRFRNLKLVSTENTSSISVVEPVPLVLSRSAEVVTIRENRVFITQRSQGWIPGDSLKAGVENWDGLYVVLKNVLHDLSAAQPEWVRWEEGPAGKLGVFRFSVDQDHAHFPVRTVVDPSKQRGYNGNPGYHAELTIDAASGAVYRLALRAIIEPGQHVSRADVAVEFSRVIIDGKSFLAPLRTVTIGVTQSLLGLFNVSYRSFQANEDIRPLMHVTDTEYSAFRPGQSKPPAVGDPAFLAASIRAMGERVTAEQLEEIVADIRGADDRDIGHRLGQLELTQRLTAARYARLRDRLQGKESRDALLALYDLSEFDDLAPSDLAPGSPPDLKMQGQIVRKAVEFVAQVTHKMPDLFATRDLTRFEDLEVIRGAVQPIQPEIKPLVMIDQSTGSVHFREGREVVETTSKSSHPNLATLGLNTKGTFGPLLEVVMRDVLDSKIGWSHWERGPSGPLAVFRYSVPAASSHWDVSICCYLTDDGLPSSFAATPGYHGELSIDPDTGAVLRLVLKADIRSDEAQQRSPLLRSDVLVDYGTENISARQYVCPTRFVSVMTSWTLGSQGLLKRSMSKGEGAKAAKKALALMEFSRVNAINEAEFHDYHVFGSEMRIVSDPGDPQSPPKN